MIHKCEKEHKWRSVRDDESDSEKVRLWLCRIDEALFDEDVDELVVVDVAVDDDDVEDVETVVVVLVLAFDEAKAALVIPLLEEERFWSIVVLFFLFSQSIRHDLKKNYQKSIGAFSKFIRIKIWVRGISATS